jgi:phage I-like protein
MSIAINFSADFSGPPEFIKLLPLGTLETRDDRGPYFVDNPAAIIALTREKSPDGAIVVDLDHSVDFAAVEGRASPAAGYASDFEIRDDGLYGRIDWTSLGKAVLSRQPYANRAYGFVSPVFEYLPGSRKVTCLLRAALTNQPNLQNMDIAICSSETRRSIEGQKMKTTAEKIAALRAELSAHSRKAHNDDALSDDERRIVGQFAGVNDEAFRAARTKRRQAALNEANATPVKIEPFTIDRVPPPRFVGF